MTVKHLYLIAAFTILACGPASGSSNSGIPTPRRTSTFLAADEIRAAHAEGGTAYDAISRLRPSWLQRGTASFDPPSTDYPVVFVDGRRYGDLESLRNIDANQIADIRFSALRKPAAGTGCRAG